ncbi:MAG TPA: TIGR03617 family F420-dependent LLM class oxidoreductase [Acidimicrobiales bacterium]|nr:TIGR03617 family F420-dependent LLM class oxidoreductase [Acidimicrobiales bacterium]
MKVDADIAFSSDVATAARSLESEGYDGIWAAETGHDPLVTLVGAASATSSVELGTGIVVAFGRSPLITATMANDLQLLSRGRLLLGLGSQIKPHIEKRYSMPWSKPAARMREYVLALRAIWDCWNDDAPLAFRGEFYRHTLMTPFFNPGPNPFGAPKVLLAAVGELMTEVAGEVADGLLVHPFTTERYVREVTLPALARGMAKRERPVENFQISLSGLITTGSSLDQRVAAATAVRQQIAFYASTPAYRGVLEVHGWAELQGTLNELSRRGAWVEMGTLISDEVLDAFSIVAEVPEVAPALLARFGDVVTRAGLYVPYHLDDAARRLVVEGLRV